TCMDFPDVGEPCPPDAGLNFCEKGAWCHQGVCRGKSAEGAACYFDQHCGEGLWCHRLSQTTGETGVCRVRSGAGGPCSVYFHCMDGLTCDQGICYPPGANGERCRGPIGITPCRAGLRCDAIENGFCRTLSREGEPCLIPWDCEPELWCSQNVCRAKTP